ncbi:MAG: hypothetical protein PHX83_07065 [Acidobacteriia bacterium]|nr:hypothetical protein [Terriglobia bacterium]
MNPETNRFETLTPFADQLVRPNGEPVPKHWTQFTVGENVVIKDYTFKVAYVGETSILFEPVDARIIGEPSLEEHLEQAMRNSVHTRR